MRCQAVSNKDGARCRNHALRYSQSCYWHDPASRRRMIEAARRGGAHRKPVEVPEAEPLTAERARAILAGLSEAVILGKVDSATAQAVEKLLQIEARIREGEGLERRVEALEMRLNSA